MLIRHGIFSCPLPRGQWATALEALALLPMGYWMFLTQSHIIRLIIIGPST